MIKNEDFDYAFDESACKACGGKCCTGESGYIFADEEELEKIRIFLNLEKEEFQKSFLKKIGIKYSFKEVKFEDGFACIFFDQNKRNCSIYEFRPRQCKTFPFWKYYKTHKEELQKECIGVYF
ncbi:zinc/iron-chelating domain-containing protein [Campylobacter sp. MIT 99-7217]|uniref:YkgJ family cysteine cluster protein n=1 Tax=Campylobacter sp. MIT 99-7217 TaxID=535091 RepID=UPI00115AC91D|nr:YkgJ family cysteine cluster protein [Campylobacter sp. MIT 99-7217]TQR34538.1 zinc/iron-chelating domain-containing protein [Campylobacter sp. MIT 99-7217]